jgi:hypothetical protein
MRVALYTSAALNYLPKVRLLFESVRAHHPDWELHLCLAEELQPGFDPGLPEGATVHPLSSLGIPAWRSWTFAHSLMELATAIKPFLLHALLDRVDAVVYLDPDIVVFSPLHEIVDGLAAGTVLLTPHQVQAAGDEADVVAHEMCTLQHGVYNLGFIGVPATPEGRRMADFWRRRTYSFCRDAIPDGVFTDQRWIDLVPAYFDRVRILRDTRLNVAPWNIAQRTMTGAVPDALEVDGKPLGFFHFSQVDAYGDDIAEPRHVAARALVAWYRGRTEQAGRRAWPLAAFRDGTPIQEAQRLVYRQRADLQAAFPDPYSVGDGSFAAWWAGQGRVEYPQLFEDSARDDAMARLRRGLLTGFAPLR